MKHVVIIFGYNNTRLYDIERLKKLCKNELNAEIMLCKENITQQDKSITANYLEVDLTKYDNDNINLQIKQIEDYLYSHSLSAIACLPFSDKGIPLGSHFAKHLGLTHDDIQSAEACIDKFKFRELERDTITPPWYKKPFFTKIYTYEEAVKIVANSKVALFFKPVAEGNSRGCLEINSITDLMNNKTIIEAYLTQGILIEECIKGFDEYSFDGVDGNYVITQKKTSSGYYRVETQHILPAPLHHHFYNRLIEAGKIVSKISGSNNGAVHNELFLNNKTGEVYCVEPNRRPAGLKLWDWVKIAYPHLDNWKSWLDWAIGIKNNGIHRDTKNQYFVGCRMLQAPYSGIINKINHHVKNDLETFSNVIEINVSKKEGNLAFAELKDNSDFLGYIVCKAKTIEALTATLNTIEKQSSRIFEIEPSSC